jgi:hypothetical protein
MAQGDLAFFNQFKLDLGKKLHDLSADAAKLGLISNAVTPAATTTDPRWGSGGSTNFSTNQVTPGGNYASGGPTIGSTTWTASGGTMTYDGADLSILQNASNPNNARWGIIYNNTDAGKRAKLFLDLGGVTDLTAGDFSVAWNALGLFTLA